MINDQVKCDHCGNDLTTTTNSVDYRLVLQSEPIPTWGGVVTDMMVYPPIEKPAHFCGIDCLKGWMVHTAPAGYRIEP